MGTLQGQKLKKLKIVAKGTTDNIEINFGSLGIYTSSAKKTYLRLEMIKLYNSFYNIRNDVFISNNKIVFTASDHTAGGADPVQHEYMIEPGCWNFLDLKKYFDEKCRELRILYTPDPADPIIEVVGVGGAPSTWTGGSPAIILEENQLSLKTKVTCKAGYGVSFQAGLIEILGLKKEMLPEHEYFEALEDIVIIGSSIMDFNFYSTFCINGSSGVHRYNFIKDKFLPFFAIHVLDQPYGSLCNILPEDDVLELNDNNYNGMNFWLTDINNVPLYSPQNDILLTFVIYESDNTTGNRE